MDRQSVFDLDSARALYRASIRSDPMFLPAHIDYIELMKFAGRSVQLRDEYAARTDLPPRIRDCLVGLSAAQASNPKASAPLNQRLLALHGPSPCVSFGHASSSVQGSPPTHDDLALGRVVVDSFPEHALSRAAYTAMLAAAGRTADAGDLLRRGLAVRPHVLQRIALTAALAVYTRETDTAAAHSIIGSTKTDVQRDGRPFVRFWFLNCFAGVNPETAHESFREQMKLARRFGSPAVEISPAQQFIHRLIDEGRVREALVEIAPRLTYAAQNNLFPYEARLRLYQGRALSKAGRAAEAAVALRAALPAAMRVGDAYHIAETHHQLAHAYESLGRWHDAAASADSYILYAGRTSDHGARVISYHDAAEIRWKAGWHAAADARYREMVDAAIREDAHYAFAGQYFERTGDAGKALSYYRRAATPAALRRAGDHKATFAGLTRMHLALGRLDSALATARIHDSLAAPPFDEILTPRVLIARRQPAEAVATMRRWLAHHVGHGAVRAQAMALNTLAEAIFAESPEEAMRLAREAADLAARNHLTAERINALRIQGEVALRSRRHEAVALLDSARTMALRHADVTQRLLIEVALGDALAARGRKRSAYDAYASGARIVERSGRTLGSTVEAERFRATRLRVFDGALRIAVADRDVPAVLQWSQRKKAALAKEASPPLRSTRVPEPRTAIIDFVVVDSVIWATVVTRRRSTLHRLPLPANAMTALARRLVDPLAATAAGHVDLARIPFDRDAARRLYDGLIRPVEPTLAGVDELVLVPDAAMHLIPFDALISSSAAERDPVYLIGRWSTRYSTTTTDGASGQVLKDNASLLAVARDAPGAKREADLLRKTWGVRLELLDRERSTETAVVRRASAVSVLHVIAHATSDESDPLSSHLSLGSDATNDGYLHYGEIESARLRPRLVVLNACETFSGEMVGAAGFMSLARAFLLGGADGVVATRWPIGASSGTLIARFYEEALNGQPLHQALRTAKLAIARDRATAHPFHWASHALIQSGRP